MLVNKGFLIAFEGIDGTGKSTQLQLLAEFLTARGCEVLVTREPTDGVYGQRIRKLYTDRSRCTPEEELELFILDRKEHVKNVIIPQLNEGNVVITDRYYYSTAAYQGVTDKDIQEIFKKNSFAPTPDLVVLLTMAPEVSIARIQEGRGENLNDFEQLDQLRFVAANFASFTESCIKRVSASREILQVQAEIRRIVMEAFINKEYLCSE